MKVRMLTTISGTRNGVDWPKAGGTIDVPDNEAADLIGTGLAVADTGKAPTEETATVAPDEDASATPRKRSRKAPSKRAAKSKG